MDTVPRESLPAYYAEMMKTEQHHNHEIVKSNDVFRWKMNDGVDEVVDMCDLNKMILSMKEKGIGKNDEKYRRLYRNMGYSLKGYWEVFYWHMNNDKADEYKPQSIPESNMSTEWEL